MSDSPGGGTARRATKITIWLLVALGTPALGYWAYYELIGWISRGPTPKEIGMAGLILIWLAGLLWFLTQWEGHAGKTFVEDVILDE